MASPSVTYTFTNGTTADATQVNQNFTDLVNGLSDGTKDLSISALTAAGNVTLNGNTTLGNASSDDLTVTASLASTIPIKTTATYDIGSSTKGLLGLYLGNSTFTTKLATGATASWTFTLPATVGVAGQGLVNAGSGTMEWKYQTVDTSAKSADYAVTDTDKIRTVLMTTSTTDRVVTLPTASDNTGRIITIKKADSAVGKVTVKGEAAGEKIDDISGTTGKVLQGINEYITVHCDGAQWWTIAQGFGSTRTVTVTGGWTGAVTYSARETRHGNYATYDVYVLASGGPTGTDLLINLPTGRTIDTNSLAGGTSTNFISLGRGNLLDSGVKQYEVTLAYESTSSVRTRVYRADGAYVSTAESVSASSPITVLAADEANLRFTVPILEWI